MEAQRVSWGRRLAKALAALVLLLAVAVLVLYLATQPMLRGRSTPAFTA
jgi:hypothetical protein